MKDPRDHILDLTTAVAWRAELRARGLTLAVTNGCFDVLHAGHLTTLMQARCAGDALLVLLNGDESVRGLKGPTRPIFCEADRAFALASLRYVDQVVIFAGTRCAIELAALQPDIYVKSGQYQHPDELDPSELQALGAKCDILFLRPLPGYSTTGIVRRLAGDGVLPSPAPSADAHSAGSRGDAGEARSATGDAAECPAVPVSGGPGGARTAPPAEEAAP